MKDKSIIPNFLGAYNVMGKTVLGYSLHDSKWPFAISIGYETDGKLESIRVHLLDGSNIVLTLRT